MAFRLTPEADEDVFDIYVCGTLNFGELPAEKYVEGLRDAFLRLSINPRLGRERVELRPPVRMIRYGSHHVFYRIEAEDVLIVRVLHGSRNWLDQMPGDDA